MKRLVFACALFALLFSGCSGWTVEPLPDISSTPFPSATPIILSATPIILPLPITATANVTPTTLTNTPVPESPTSTDTATPVTTEVITTTPIISVLLTLPPTITSTPSASVDAEILSCNTSIDITHGMGEVTNAYVTISNISEVNLMNVCATLNAPDEGRPHPDKTKCVASLPAGYQVSEKLTVDFNVRKSLAGSSGRYDGKHPAPTCCSKFLHQHRSDSSEGRQFGHGHADPISLRVIQV